MYSITPKIRSDVRRMMIEEGCAPGTPIRIFLCSKCGGYMWSKDTDFHSICPVCGLDDNGQQDEDAEPEFMQEEDITL